LNLFDNSIWWLEYSKIKNPSIYIGAFEFDSKRNVILVADNGPGFSISTEQATKAFVSDKPGGMGIGLHLTDQIMSSLEGQLVFPEYGDFPIPRNYRKGAIVGLVFKKGDK
jgi:nitrogen fixation/metabolism regulation signal transduction histidine kinase